MLPFSPRKTASRICPPSYRRGLRLEWLEGRDVPATFLVGDDLVPGADIAALNDTSPGYQVVDRNADDLLNTGDLVRVTLPGDSTTTDFTFRTDLTTPAITATDRIATATISSALTAAASVAGADTIYVAAGTYAESLAVNSTVNLIGLTGVATDVVIDPTAGDAVTVTATGVTLEDLLVTGAVNGITASAAVTDLTLINVTVGADNPATGGTTETNTGIGLDLAGTGTLTLTDVTLTGNAGRALDVSGFATLTVSGLRVTAATGAAQSAIDLGAGTANATLNLTAGAAGGTITVTGTSLQVGTGETISLANVDALNLTGGVGADAFVVTAPASGGTAISITGGAGPAVDTLDLTGTTGLTVTSTYAAGGFSGTITSGTTATISFSGIESFLDGSTLSGRVFVDTNNNQTQDSGEAGLAGVRVYLDADGDNVFDTGELSVVTDTTGAYSFVGLPPGSYSVRLVASGLTLTTTATPAAVSISTLGQTGLAAVNFGVKQTSGGTVTGVLFGDTDADGTRDAGESPIAGATVYLDLDGDSQLDPNEPSDVTDAAGAFALSTGTNGTFALRVAAPLPSGFALPATLPTVGLTGGAAVTKNLGLVPSAAGATGGSVSGTVFADVVTQNGTQDSGESGVRGVTVFLDLDNDGRLDQGEPTSVTDPNGDYTITTTQNVTSVAVRAVLSPGYLRSTTLPTVTLTGGAAVTGADIGLKTNLPPQATPARRLAAGYIIGGQAHVKTFGPDGRELSDTIVFAGLNTRDVRVAVADVTGDGVDDVIVGTGPGVPTQVVVLDGTNLQVVATITPFESTFTGGVYVAAGDVNQDGIADIIITPDEGGGPRVLVYEGGPVGASGSFTPIASFFGIEDVNFRGGARVTVADVNRDGVPDLIVAAGFGGGPRVAVYNGTSILSGITRLINDFFIFEQTLRNGAFITAGDLDGDGFADLIGGGGPGGGPRVLALSGAQLMAGRGVGASALANFFAGNSNDRNGVRVVAKDVDGDGKAEIYTGTGNGNSNRVRRFKGNGSDDGFDRDFGGNSGVFVG